jgi:protein TonB
MQHLNTKQATMKTTDIMQADLLDIIFEHRNKDYGAYALRRDYDHRLLISLGAAMSVIVFFVLFNVLGNKNEPTPDPTPREEVMITTVEFPKEKPREPEKPKEIAKPEKIKTAKVKNTPIKVVPDKKADPFIPTETDKKEKETSTVNVEGETDKNIVKPVETPVTGTGPVTVPAEPVKKENDFIIQEKDPEFPGGAEALKRFLALNLTTPEDLQSGEKKTVQVRFKVEKDGLVTSFEVVSSGGTAFDREVMRVCKKMPRWKPAIQNGVHVPVSYLLPVTFIGVEQ